MFKEFETDVNIYGGKVVVNTSKVEFIRPHVQRFDVIQDKTEIWLDNGQVVVVNHDYEYVKRWLCDMM